MTILNRKPWKAITRDRGDFSITYVDPRSFSTRQEAETFAQDELSLFAWSWEYATAARRNWLGRLK